MLVHSVYFWLKSELSDDEKKKFFDGLQKLRGIPSVVQLYVGTPAKTQKRKVLDDSYTYGIVVIFNDIVGHDEYQSHPIHQEFLNYFSSYWERILVYDVEG